MTDSKNSQALIIGANGGIGLGFVHYLLNQSPSPHIYATYRDRTKSEDLLALAEQHPGLVDCIPVDVTQEDHIIALTKTIQSANPAAKLHQVIYCVGLLHDGDLQPEKSLRQINADSLAQYFQVNSIGAVLFAKHLLPLLTHGDRSIFACISAKIGSIGDNRLGGWYGYRASKAALNMFMKTVAIEYQRKSPQTIIALLHPGTTDTALSQPFQRNVPPEKLFPVERTVHQLMTILDSLEVSQTGQFFSWDGQNLPW